LLAATAAAEVFTGGHSMIVLSQFVVVNTTVANQQSGIYALQILK
jgi:hypothetical protein